MWRQWGRFFKFLMITPLHISIARGPVKLEEEMQCSFGDHYLGKVVDPKSELHSMSTNCIADELPNSQVVMTKCLGAANQQTNQSKSTKMTSCIRFTVFVWLFAIKGTI